jgi:uncharacterized RDD family membrane protein YckC
MTNSSTGQFDFSHWLLRLVAFIIDSIIIAIPTGIIWFIITLSAAFTGSYFFFAYGAWLVFPLILGIIQVLYFVILDVTWGATIGKRILGFQVQMTTGGKVPFDKAFIRNISKIYWLLLVLDWLIGVVTAGADRRQKYTDRIAGTTVVAVRQAFSSPSPTSSPPPPPPPPT